MEDFDDMRIYEDISEYFFGEFDSFVILLFLECEVVDEKGVFVVIELNHFDGASFSESSF